MADLPDIDGSPYSIRNALNTADHRLDVVEGVGGSGLTPEEFQSVVDAAEDEVLEGLVPPVSFVVLFENALQP